MFVFSLKESKLTRSVYYVKTTGNNLINKLCWYTDSWLHPSDYSQISLSLPNELIWVALVYLLKPSSDHLLILLYLWFS